MWPKPIINSSVAQGIQKAMEQLHPKFQPLCSKDDDACAMLICPFLRFLGNIGRLLFFILCLAFGMLCALCHIIYFAIYFVVFHVCCFGAADASSETELSPNDVHAEK